MEQAIQCAIELTGCSRDEVFNDEYGLPEREETLVWADEEMTHKISVGELLKTFTEPYFAFGTE